MPNKSPLPTGISTPNSNQQRSSRAGGRAPRWANLNTSMQIISRRKGFPVIGALAILVAGALIVLGGLSLNGGDQVKAWLNIITGLLLLVSWTANIMLQVVQIRVDDREIRYHRRNGQDTVIDLSDVFDCEVLSTRVRIRYKGPLDVQSASIPLRRFGQSEAERLRAIFTERNNAQQDGGGNAPEPPSHPSTARPKARATP